MNESKLWFSNQMIVCECCTLWKKAIAWTLNTKHRSHLSLSFFYCILYVSMSPSIVDGTHWVVIQFGNNFQCSFVRCRWNISTQNIPNVIGKVSQNNFYCLFSFINIAIIIHIVPYSNNGIHISIDPRNFSVSHSNILIIMRLKMVLAFTFFFLFWFFLFSLVVSFREWIFILHSKWTSIFLWIKHWK